MVEPWNGRKLRKP